MRLLTSGPLSGPDRGRGYDPRGPPMGDRPPVDRPPFNFDHRSGPPADFRGGAPPPADYRAGPPADFRAGPLADFRGPPNDYRSGMPSSMGDYRGPSDPRGPAPNMPGAPPSSFGHGTGGPGDGRDFDPRGLPPNIQGNPGPGGPGGPNGPNGPGMRGDPRDPRDPREFDLRGGPPARQGGGGAPSNQANPGGNTQDMLSNLLQHVQNNGGIQALANESTRAQVLAALSQNPQLVQALVQKMPPGQQQPSVGMSNQQQQQPPMGTNPQVQGMPQGQQPPPQMSMQSPPMHNMPSQHSGGMPDPRGPGGHNGGPGGSGGGQGAGQGQGGGPGGGLDLNSLQDLLAATAPLLGQGSGQQKQGYPQGGPPQQGGYPQSQPNMQQQSVQQGPPQNAGVVSLFRGNCCQPLFQSLHMLLVGVSLPDLLNADEHPPS